MPFTALLVDDEPLAREGLRMLLAEDSEIAEVLVAMTDEGQRLRQNSPFAGVLPAAEVWEIKRRIREASAV